MMTECLTEGRERRRGMGVVLAGVLAATALAAVLAAVAMAAPRLGFIHVRTNLSMTQDFKSARPDLAVSSNGDRVVVVWTEGYLEKYTSFGHVYLRSASESGGGWENRIEVFHGDSSACAHRAAVAVRGTTAHVAYIVREGGEHDGCTDPDKVRLYYKTCSLTSETCSADGVVDSVNMSDHTILEVDLALDDSGNPHIVYARYLPDENNGDILYKTKTGTSWEGLAVETDGDNRAPAIAWANSYAHVVWRKHSLVSRYVYYRRSDSPSSPWIDNLSAPGPHLGDPDVAARGGKVFLVWDRCTETPPVDEDCEKYSLVYFRSDNNGQNFGQALEVGTDHTDGNYSEEYDSIDNTYGFRREVYLISLQPAIALNDDGWPVVVWHVDSSGGNGNEYTIYYTYAISGTGSAVDWAFTSTVLNEYHPSWLGSAAVGVAGSGEDQHLHVAYMQKPSKVSEDAWDVCYDSNERDRYKFAYLPLVFKGSLAD